MALEVASKISGVPRSVDRSENRRRSTVTLAETVGRGWITISSRDCHRHGLPDHCAGAAGMAFANSLITEF